jgi:lipopolysaccharide transport system ATP-binding protein
MKRIQELLDGGTTLIFVSHNMGLVKAVCDLGLYIDHGRLVHFGATSEVVEGYNRALNEKRINNVSSTNLVDDELLDGGIEITKVEILSSDTLEGNIFRPDLLLRVVVHYSAYSDIGPIAVVLRIIRTDGLSCSVMYSRLDGVQLSVKGGTGTISAVIDPIQLFPGVYYVVATIKNAGESITYTMGSSEWFKVKGEIKGYEDRDAVFEPNRTWDHCQTSESDSSTLRGAEKYPDSGLSVEKIIKPTDHK